MFRNVPRSSGRSGRRDFLLPSSPSALACRAGCRLGLSILSDVALFGTINVTYNTAFDVVLFLTNSACRRPRRTPVPGRTASCCNGRHRASPCPTGPPPTRRRDGCANPSSPWGRGDRLHGDVGCTLGVELDIVVAGIRLDAIMRLVRIERRPDDRGYGNARSHRVAILDFLQTRPNGSRWTGQCSGMPSRTRAAT